MKPKTIILLSIIISLTYLYACKSQPRNHKPTQLEFFGQLEAVNPTPQTNQKVELSDSKPSSSVRFEPLSVEDGLPQNSVRCMLQDAQGYMWFCTSEGLAKYDGYDFTVYSHNPDDPNSLNENWVEAIFEDHSLTLWVATRGRWLERFDR